MLPPVISCYECLIVVSQKLLHKKAMVGLESVSQASILSICFSHIPFNLLFPYCFHVPRNKLQTRTDLLSFLHKNYHQRLAES